VLAIEAKKIFAKPRFPLGHPGSRTKDVAETLGEVSAKDRTLVMEWVSVWRSALALTWRSASALTWR
jgi:hypothetical protein